MNVDGTEQSFTGWYGEAEDKEMYGSIDGPNGYWSVDIAINRKTGVPRLRWITEKASSKAAAE